MVDAIIIGGGPAGMTAALYLLRSNKTVLILERDSFGGQIATSPKVENFPSIKEISGLELSDQMFSQIDAMGAQFELEDVESINKEGDIFTVKTNYNEHQAKVVIIANGVKHRKMNLPKEDDLCGKGISFCAVCDGPMYKGQDVYLIGDANTAIQYALMLSNYCPTVHMFTLFDRFFGDSIIINRLKAKENIVVKHNQNLVEYLGDGELKGLVFEDTKTKECTTYQTNNVFIAIGQIPQNEQFANLVDLEKGYIVTNNDMETKTQGLFAIGDTRKKDIRQCITACNDGAIAALSSLKYLG